MRPSRFASQLPVWSILAALVLVGPSTPAVAVAGQRDPTFGEGGIVRTGFGRTFAFATGMAIQDDGRIVVVGGVRSLVSGRLEWGVARYLPDGRADPSFDENGKVRTRFGAGDAIANDVAVRPDGRIIVVGTVIARAGSVFAMGRYEADGSLDEGFSGNGRRFTRMPSFRDAEANAVALQSHGSFVVAGSASSASAQVFASARYQPDGRLDRTFGANGKVVTDVGGGAANDVAVLPDGRILAAGIGGGYGATFARYRTGGTLDRTFARDGIKRLISAGDARAIGLQADGAIVAAVLGGVLRLTPDGRLDDTFGGDGMSEPFPAIGEGLAVANDGTILLVGSTDTSNNEAALVARYRSQGRLDTTFGDEGIVGSAFGAFNEFGRAVALQRNGKIVVAGSAGDDYGESRFAAARFVDRD
jgi:uncharacterized delta-60 repeat protein